MKEDCSQVEINPLIVTKDDHVLALDAKIELRRQRRLPPQGVGRAARHLDEEKAKSRSRPRQPGSRYIQLDGNIGCLVNGAGLAMATMDIIKHYGGQPANFLDVGGGADQGSGHQGVQDHPVVAEREGHLRQHLRRHHEVRHRSRTA